MSTLCRVLVLIVDSLVPEIKVHISVLVREARSHSDLMEVWCFEKVQDMAIAVESPGMPFHCNCLVRSIRFSVQFCIGLGLVTLYHRTVRVRSAQFVSLLGIYRESLEFNFSCIEGKTFICLTRNLDERKEVE